MLVPESVLALVGPGYICFDASQDFNWKPYFKCVCVHSILFFFQSHHSLISLNQMSEAHPDSVGAGLCGWREESPLSQSVLLVLRMFTRQQGIQSAIALRLFAEWNYL